MKKLLVVAGLTVFGYILYIQDVGPLRNVVGRLSPSTTNADVFAEAFEEHRENFVAEGTGKVIRLLADDNDGSRHQRFIVELSSGQTLLVSHNIDLAPRIDALSVGDTVDFKGEYEWNDKGGVMHWTHHDPAGRHEAGWIRHNGSIYQ
jgi:Protein of unknown function (DUF3465)